MPTLWQRSKKRLFALAAAGAAGAGAAYLAYNWYYSSTADDDDTTQATTSRITDEASTSGGSHNDNSNNNRRQPQNEIEAPLLVDPTGKASGVTAMDAEAHLQHHFDSIQDIAQGTTLPSLLPALARALAAAAEVDATLDRLRQGNLPADQKVAAWEQLKRDAFAELLAACWALPLLDLLVKVQLNVLGRHLYLETALAAKGQHSYSGPRSPPPPRLSAPSQEKFLSYAEYLAKEGHIALLHTVRRVSDTVIGPIALQTTIDTPTLNELLSKGMELLEGERWGDLLLPPPAVIRDSLTVRRPDDRAMLPGAEAMLVDGTAVETLVGEVARIVSSDRFHDVVVVCAKHSAGCVATRLSANMSSVGGVGGTEGGGMALARVVPLITAEARRVLTPRGAAGVGLSELEDVKKLCATVYSCGPPL